jgi:hypothetical protein
MELLSNLDKIILFISPVALIIQAVGIVRGNPLWVILMLITLPGFIQVLSKLIT